MKSIETIIVVILGYINRTELILSHPDHDKINSSKKTKLDKISGLKTFRLSSKQILLFCPTGVEVEIYILLAGVSFFSWPRKSPNDRVVVPTHQSGSLKKTFFIFLVFGILSDKSCNSYYFSSYITMPQ